MLCSPKITSVAISAALFAAGCAGSDTHLRLLEQQNALRVEPAHTPGADFVVSFRNLLDIGFNPDNPATRHAAALQILRDQCPNGKVVGETAINIGGEYLTGRKSMTYAVRVKC